MPAKTANPIARIEKSLIENLFQAETITAITVITAAITLRLVIIDLPVPINPTWSTHREIAVCPARDATVKSATGVYYTSRFNTEEEAEIYAEDWVKKDE